MKRLIIFLSILCAVTIYSQDITKAKNTIYLDFGLIFSRSAVAVGCGLNYERMLNDNFSLRGGVNIGFFGAGVSGDAISGTCLSFPVTFNYMTKQKNKFEAGLGGGPFFNLEQEKSFSFFPAAKLGYRYQPDEGGLMLKAGLEVPANTYLSIGGIGYTFK
ncbi:MAG: hypothetical protein HY959_02560 [Ignavibacteriae bacterium]|nr:hypothetical protein [Ignavibacteriota bacterium]